MITDRFITQFRAARRCGVPLIAVQTPDPAATIERLRNASAASTPMIQWDSCRGWYPANKAGEAAIAEALGGVDPSNTLNPTQMLAEWAPALPQDEPGERGGSVLYCINAHRYLLDGTASGAAFVQAVWNLRDLYKVNGRTLVLLGASFNPLPVELQGDVLVLDEPLPDDPALDAIVGSILDSAGGGACDVKCRADAVDALRGLAAFPAEQATAMAVDPKSRKLDLAELWTRKEKMIGATPGLAVYKGGDTLDDVGGCEQVKRYIKMKAQGKQPFRAVVFIDEGEKMFAGATAGTGDSSGVSQGFLGTMLTWQQEANDRGSTGMLFVGPPGAAKSMVAKATGASFGVPTISLDLGGMKASLVGESERQLRQALKVVDAVGGGRVLVIMTCNKEVALPPELKRRYKGGIFYFDLPEPDEQEVIWQKYQAKFEIAKSQKRPKCPGWTGAEIRTACELHWDLGIPLAETAQFIVPVAVSAREEIAALRRQAQGRYLSASRPGVYQSNALPEEAAKPARRMAGSEV